MSLKALGEKNPYRYRGYRYDTETGYYYLQSRYYNPEWGRFLNADALGGSIGELLSHNTFAYCNNNPVNGKDPNGFRPIYTQGEETDAMRRASYKAMEEFYTSRSTSNSSSVRKSNSVGGIMPTSNQAREVVTGGIIGAVEGRIGSLLSSIPDNFVYYANRVARRHGGLAIPVKGSSTVRAIGKVEGVGGIGIVLTGVAVWDNYHSGYSKEEAFWRSAIDVGAAALAIGVGFFTPVGWGIGLGMAIGIGAEVGKNYLWGRD